MAIDVFPKRWGTIPPASARAIPGHPLCPRFGFVFDGVALDLARKFYGTNFGSGNGGIWSTSSSRLFPGKVREHNSTGDQSTLGLDSDFLPTQEITIVLAYQKTDATLRNAVAFGNATATTGQFCAAYVPFTDGKVYFDFGGETAGTTRVNTAGSPTVGDDIWTFTTGPRGMEIWQNAVLQASNGVNPTRANGAVNFQLGRHKNGTITSDLAKWKFFYIYHRQLGGREIMELVMQPFQWVDPRP